ncbi:MAG: hypothetical protein HY812_05140 [Planctomycetes bacterium]|nr:hypothetical protein [Planctomycetota bacterium]
MRGRPHRALPEGARGQVTREERAPGRAALAGPSRRRPAPAAALCACKGPGRQPHRGDQLLADVRPEDLEAWRRGSLADWASESFQLALRYAYQDERGEPVASGQRLGRAYLTTRTVIVDEQLKKAAVRLAWLLNEVLK